MRWMGIDPGSQRVGWGFVDVAGSRLTYVDSGVILLNEQALSERLLVLSQSLDALLARYQPSEAAVETIFIHKNVQSAFVLAHARGVVLLELQKKHIPIREFSPTHIKQAVTGHGRAEKEQVAAMVRMILHRPEHVFQHADASDALAMAICCANHTHLFKRIV